VALHIFDIAVCGRNLTSIPNYDLPDTCTVEELLSSGMSSLRYQLKMSFGTLRRVALGSIIRLKRISGVKITLAITETQACCDASITSYC
jgi:hypothetical protein